jgi:hypothetical protein
MDWDLFIKIASVIGAFGTVGGCFAAIYKILRKIEKHNEKVEEHMRENYKSILRLTIMSPEMPLSERIKSADIYLSDKIKGNGAVKSYVNEVLRPKWVEEQCRRCGENAEN